jgi:hypothetical protein
MAVDVVLSYAHEGALVVEACAGVSTEDDGVHHDDVEDVAEEHHTTVVIQRQQIHQLQERKRVCVCERDRVRESNLELTRLDHKGAEG